MAMPVSLGKMCVYIKNKVRSSAPQDFCPQLCIRKPSLLLPADAAGDKHICVKVVVIDERLRLSSSRHTMFLFVCLVFFLFLFFSFLKTNRERKKK